MPFQRGLFFRQKRVQRGFLEGRAAGAFPQQHRVHAHGGGAVFHRRPQLPRHVEIGDALVVAMQVEHDVVADGQPQQPRFQPLVDGFQPRLVGQEAGILSLDQREIAVEIGAGTEVETPFLLGEMVLGAADRVGPRHQRDVASDASLGLGLRQFRHQRVDGDGSRQFAGVQGGLQIGGRSRLIGARKPEHREFIGDAFAVALQPLDRFFHRCASCRQAGDANSVSPCR